MSITPEAIQKLGVLSHIPQFLKQVEDAQVQSQLVVLPNEYKVSDLESYQEHRNSYRGDFRTPVIQQFVDYAFNYSVDGSKTFIDVQSMSAEAVFDLGTTDKPGHQRHKAELKLRKTAPFKTLLGRDGRPAEQREMAEWLEDNTEFLKAFSSDGESIDMPKAIAAVRELTFEHKRGRESNVQDFAQQQSEYEQMATKTRDDLVLPAVFTYTCEPYQGLPEFIFELRVSIKGADTINLRIKNLEAMEEKIANKFLELLESKFAEKEVNISLFIGEWR